MPEPSLLDLCHKGYLLAQGCIFESCDLIDTEQKQNISLTNHEFLDEVFLMADLEVKLAQITDVPAISSLMRSSIDQLQTDYLTPEQIKASHAGMGLDTQLIEDRTYYCVWSDTQIIGCGGWSFRATLYGGNHSSGRDAATLNPAMDRARIRAMYTHPDHTRKGVGRLILNKSETAAKAAGFSSLEMAATLAGEPFYRRCGYEVESRWVDRNGAVAVPLLTMVKSLSP